MPSNRQINERELRESEIKMTGRPPAATVAFIGFVPTPNTPPANGNTAAPSSNGAAPQRPSGG